MKFYSTTINSKNMRLTLIVYVEQAPQLLSRLTVKSRSTLTVARSRII